MMNDNQFKEILKRVKGKTIAIVYVFEGEDPSRLNHFSIWKGKVLTGWVNAVQELDCMLLILDIRTFVDKAMNGTLPHIDYVLNMNSGTYDLSSLALVPAACSTLKVPCIPCNAVSVITGESKSVSNLIADSLGLQIPKTLEAGSNDGIFRPNNLGNSLGVKKGGISNDGRGIYQEFIEGYDITTPAVYNAMTQKMELLPTIIYLPENNDLSWFHGEQEKRTQKGYQMKTISLDKETSEKYIALIDALSIQTFCRIDARIKCNEAGFYHDTANDMALFENTYFVEINAMPTIRENNSFCLSFDSIPSSHSLYPCIKAQEAEIGTININSFLLASAMMSYMRE